MVFQEYRSRMEILTLNKTSVALSMVLSVTLLSACVGERSAQEKLRAGADETLRAGTKEDVRRAQTAEADVPSQEKPRHAWLLAQLEHRCVREKGGAVSNEVLEIPMPGDDSASQEANLRNPWLTPPKMQFTASVKDPKVRHKRRQDKHYLEPKTPRDKATQKIRLGHPVQTLSLKAADGTVVEVVTSGCAGAAVRQLYGVEPEVYHATVMKVGDIHRLQDTVAQLPALAELQEKYVKCMASREQVVSSVGRAPQPLVAAVRHVNEGSGSVAEVQRLEEKYVAADADCRSKTHISEAYAVRYLREKEKMESESQNALLSHRQMVKHADQFQSEYLAKHRA